MPASTTQKATIYDVADRAGVSIATVSRTFNGYEDVSESTRKRVRAAARALRFRPSRPARSLAQQGRRTIGVAVPTFTTAFHNELLKGIRDRLERQEADLLLCDLDWQRPLGSLRGFLSGGAIDGLILVGAGSAPDLRSEVGALGSPAVLLGGSMEGVDTFGWNDVEGARTATKHLIDQGYSKIRMITSHHEDPTRDARIDGFRLALREAGLGFEDAWIATGQTDKQAGFSEESGQEAMEALLERHPDVEAVFACSDVQAIGAWQALRRKNRRVPEDVALIGYDDLKVSRFIGLSSVSQRTHSVGWEATRLLLKRLGGNGPTETISQVIEPDVIRRAST